MNVFYYKIICLIIGLLIVFMGYKLFVKGLFIETGEIEGGWKDFKIVIRKAAAGTYFVLFGSAIIIYTILQGYSETSIQNETPDLIIKTEPKIIKDTIQIK